MNDRTEDARLIGYSNLSREGVTLLFDRPVSSEYGGLRSKEWWLSWVQIARLATGNPNIEAARAQREGGAR